MKRKRDFERRKDHRKQLDKATALAIAVEEGLPLAESVRGVPYSSTPVSISRVEIGWLVQFAPTSHIDADGRKVFNVQYIVDDRDRRLHPVGTFGARRIVEEILYRRG
ncbi:hypothetical protein Pla22_47460 [Rubripirellula amarantea]|uniref:Uncharacterized protein n=1 Tax=Rubripirellula amarantea TaxID=2527999 RepID=A0A5C5WHG7_9BACT|nr:hypothetical protein [Rubripirellula amarantea]TWT49549.1 hypothetical protein Pla22_47460 [Rubripirellula amarantea]